MRSKGPHATGEVQQAQYIMISNYPIKTVMHSMQQFLQQVMDVHMGD